MLKDKAAIVTGSTSGIGLGIATALAAQKSRVMLNGFGDRAAIENIRKGLAEQHGVKTAYSSADVSRPAEIRALIESAERELGAVDILVNNAGIQHVAPVEEFPDDNHGLVASAEKAGYVAAKHGLVGLTKVVAIETANSGVTCNAICPGWVLTPLVQKQVEAKAKEAGISVEQAKENLLREKQPMLRFTSPEQVGALAVFLCGDHAATLTGAALSVDGGWTAQ